MSSHSSPPINFDVAIHKIVREEWGHILSILIKKFKDIELAEDVLQDAVETAVKNWRSDGIPEDTFSWLLKVAGNKAIDRLRRQKNFQKKLNDYTDILDDLNDNIQSEDSFVIPEERLRLIFTCCHPALDQSISVALTLQLLGGLRTAEIARAFLVKKETMDQRLVRGKRKIKQAGIPYKIPEKEDFPERLDAVLSVLYLIFNEGYSASSGRNHIRAELCQEAIRLTRVLCDLCDNQPEVEALLALMLLHHSRHKARYNQDGSFIPLEYQNRDLWIDDYMQEGQFLVEKALKQKKIGPYQLQAAISAIHSEAKKYNQTNWHEIVLLYDELYKLLPTPIIELNKLAALSNIISADEVLNKLNLIESHFDRYQPFYATKADLLFKVGKTADARKYYNKAIDLSGSDTEKEFLRNQMGRTE